MPDPMQEQDTGSQKASPEEQALLKMMLANASKLIHGESSQQIVQSLQSGKGEPSHAVGVTAFHILNQMVNSMQQAGKTPTKNVLRAAAVEVIDMLTEMADAANVINLQSEKETQEFEAKALKAFADEMQMNKGASQGAPAQQGAPAAPSPAPAPAGPIGQQMGGM